MLDRPPAIALLAVGCVLALAVGSAGVLPEEDDRAGVEPETGAEPEKLVREMLAAEPAAVDGHLTETTTRNEKVVERTRYEVLTDPSDDSKRVRIVRPDESNLTVVQNRTTAWTYDEGTDEVTKYDLTDSGGVIVPALQYDHYDRLLSALNVTYAGTERVAGHEAQVVVFNDTSEEPTTAGIEVLVGDTEISLAETTLSRPVVLAEHRLWIHAAEDYPLKRQTTLVGREGSSVKFTTRYDRIEFETDPDEDTFQFDPPEDATRQDPPEMDSERFDSIEAAASAVSYRVPDPTVPERFELDSVIVSRVNGSTRVRVAYADGNESVRVRVLPDVDHDIEGMSVTVGDHAGTLTGGYGTSSLYWQCAGRTYAVYGPVSASEKLSIAESIDCEAASR